jgi:preprotein translocase subunit SecE
MRQFQQYLKEVVEQLKKVTWPKWDELKGSTLVVIVFSIIMAFYIWGIDMVLTWGLSQIMNVAV